MYTYESFVTDGTFTLLRPIFYSFLFIVLVLFILVLLPKAKMRFLNGFAVTVISILSIIVSAQLLFFDAIIVDELGLGGDGIATLTFVAIAVLGGASPIIFFIRQQEGKA